MDLSFLLRGFAIGFNVAVGVGPITLLTIRRTLAHGRVYGLASGLGVASADASYGAIAAFGLTALTAVLVGARTLLAFVGGLFLVWLGARTVLAPPPDQAASVRERPGLLGAAISIYGLRGFGPSWSGCWGCDPPDRRRVPGVDGLVGDPDLAARLVPDADDAAGPRRAHPDLRGRPGPVRRPRARAGDRQPGLSAAIIGAERFDR